MPKSRIRRRRVFTPPSDRQQAVRVGSPRWLAPAMVTFFVIGLLWVVVFYVTQGDYPVGSIGSFNILAGFAFMAVGFALSTKWK